MNIDDKVYEWHLGNSELSLREYLGMSVEECEYWVKYNKYEKEQ